MMEPDKSLQEGLFRSHQATGKASQAQSKLYDMSKPDQAAKPQPELHESPRNLLQSWNTLRQLDEALEDKKTNHVDQKSAKQ